MRSVLLYVLILCGMSGSASAETLQELLTKAGIPAARFSPRELASKAQGTFNTDASHTVLAYRTVEGDGVTGPLRLVEFTKSNARVLRRTASLAENDVCNLSGSADSLYFLHQYTLIGKPLSPSAQCLLVFDDALELRHVFYGFEPTEVLPGKFLIYEDMIHFSPVHPGRLQLADLRTGSTLELYPPLNDPLRKQLTREHAKRMPPKNVCEQMNDPCSPELFNEEPGTVVTNSAGRFAFLATQSADHATKPDTPPETVVAQNVFYVYQHQHGAWLYCEEKVRNAEVDSLNTALRGNDAAVLNRCTPNRRVIPDLSTADYNPSLNAKPGKRSAPR